MSLKQYEEALQYAVLAVQISTTTGTHPARIQIYLLTQQMLLCRVILLSAQVHFHIQHVVCMAGSELDNSTGGSEGTFVEEYCGSF